MKLMSASDKLSFEEYRALSYETREAMRLENLSATIAGKIPRRRQLASSVNLTPAQEIERISRKTNVDQAIVRKIISEYHSALRSEI